MALCTRARRRSTSRRRLAASGVSAVCIGAPVGERGWLCGWEPEVDSLSEWFAAFLADRGTRKPSAHSMKAYRQDFDAIATLVAGTETRTAAAQNTLYGLLEQEG
jgi:hypothetical protein